MSESQNNPAQNNPAFRARIILGPEMMSAVIAWQCREDEAFRDRFEQDPRACIEELSGEKLPAELKITVRENSDEVWNIPLPSPESLEAPVRDLLSDEDMEQISGGLGFIGGAITGSVTSVLVTVAVISTISGVGAAAAVGLGITAAIVLTQ